MEFTGALIIAGLIAFFILLFAAKGFKIVQQSEVMIIERLGRYNRTLESGINIIWPIIDKPRLIHWRLTMQDIDGNKYSSFKLISKIDLRETVYDFARQTTISGFDENERSPITLLFML